MRSRRPTRAGLILFGLIAVVASAGFVRLGIWQLDRHKEVRRENGTWAALIALEPVRLDASVVRSLNVDTLLWRRVELSGRWEFDREVVIRSRARSGTPGIHVVTPLRLNAESATADGDGAGVSVLVLRGWLPSPDASTARLALARSEVAVSAAFPRLALVRASRAGHGGPMIQSGSGEAGIPTYAAIDVELIADAHAETAPFFVQLLPDDDSAGDRAGQPMPVPLPTLGNGPHLTYMIQWFSFALITMVGSGVFLRREMRARG